MKAKVVKWVISLARETSEGLREGEPIAEFTDPHQMSVFRDGVQIVDGSVKEGDVVHFSSTDGEPKEAKIVDAGPPMLWLEERDPNKLMQIYLVKLN